MVYDWIKDKINSLPTLNLAGGQKGFLSFYSIEIAAFFDPKADLKLLHYDPSEAANRSKTIGFTCCAINSKERISWSCVSPALSI